MKLHEAIRALRTSLGDTQSAFGKRTNLSSSSVAHFENGSRRPDPGSLVFLARAAFKVGRKDLAEIFVAELPGVSEELLIPVWRTNLGQPPALPETESKGHRAIVYTQEVRQEPYTVIAHVLPTPSPKPTFAKVTLLPAPPSKPTVAQVYLYKPREEK